MMARCYHSAGLLLVTKLPSLWAWLALFFAFFFAACLPAAASGLSSNWIGDPSFGKARLISAITARGDLDHYLLV